MRILRILLSVALFIATASPVFAHGFLPIQWSHPQLVPTTSHGLLTINHFFFITATASHRPLSAGELIHVLNNRTNYQITSRNLEPLLVLRHDTAVSQLVHPVFTATSNIIGLSAGLPHTVIFSGGKFELENIRDYLHSQETLDEIRRQSYLDRLRAHEEFIADYLRRASKTLDNIVGNIR